MSGLRPSFLSSSLLQIRIGSTAFAFAQNLTFTDDMTVVPVGGIGSYNYQALEPVQYMGRGSLVITHYSSSVLKNIAAANKGLLPARAPQDQASLDPTRDGNSLFITEWFSPATLVISRTFDVDVYERKMSSTGALNGTAATGNKIYTLSNCRATGLSMTFTPGTILQQVMTFLCTSITDYTAEGASKQI